MFPAISRALKKRPASVAISKRDARRSFRRGSGETKPGVTLAGANGGPLPGHTARLARRSRRGLSPIRALQEISRLFLVALIGVALNSAVVWILAEFVRLDPTLAKVLAVLPVLAWNYVGRRLMVFDSALTQGVAELTNRID